MAFYGYPTFGDFCRAAARIWREAGTDDLRDRAEQHRKDRERDALIAKHQLEYADHYGLNEAQRARYRRAVTRETGETAADDEKWALLMKGKDIGCFWGLVVGILGTILVYHFFI
jgi:hypothetical protein